MICRLSFAKSLLLSISLLTVMVVAYANLFRKGWCYRADTTNVGNRKFCRINVGMGMIGRHFVKLSSYVVFILIIENRLFFPASFLGGCQFSTVFAKSTGRPHKGCTNSNVPHFVQAEKLAPQHF